VDRPETRWVTVGDADVAYQVVGEGPFDLLYFNGLGSHIEYIWDDPSTAEFLRTLASFSRVILFDRRGTGASDAVPHAAIPTWEEWTEDIGAVLDAVGSERAAIMTQLDGGPISILYAAAHPDRVSALVLTNTTARFTVSDDYPIGASHEAVETLLELIRTGWGTPQFQELILPSLANDPDRLALYARITRSSATPRSATAQYAYVLRSDARNALSMIQAPTLVLHARENRLLPIDHGRYLADHIPGARLVELTGEDVVGGGPSRRQTLEEIAEFLTGSQGTVPVERVLTTILFTDIVGSTEHLSSLGDQRWRSLLDSHDRCVREQLRQFRGIEIATTGDGFMASFDGPGRAIRCAQATAAATGKLGIDLRFGLHTGECEVRGHNLAGLAVHVAARVGAQAGASEVLVSQTVKDLVAGSGIEFKDRGDYKLKGVSGSWKLFSVVS
jgi:class 3 adenylate cyclase